MAHGGRHLGAADGHQGASGAGTGRRPRNGDGVAMGDGGTMGKWPFIVDFPIEDGGFMVV